MWELLTGDEPYADLHYGAIIGNSHKTQTHTYGVYTHIQFLTSIQKCRWDREQHT